MDHVRRSSSVLLSRVVRSVWCYNCYSKLGYYCSLPPPPRHHHRHHHHHVSRNNDTCRKGSLGNVIFTRTLTEAKNGLQMNVFRSENEGAKDSDGDGGGSGDGDNRTDIAHFHFHPTCNSETISSVRSSFRVIASFISEAEEDLMMREVEPHLTRRKYEFDHWDEAIHGFREIERSRWSEQVSTILSRVYRTAFSAPSSTHTLPQTHVLDLAESGVIKPHVDSVRFCGNIICGLSLLSDAVMRLRHVEMKDQITDVLLHRRSLYIMRDEVRYKYTHEVLGQTETFNGKPVLRGRRVSIITRNKPIDD